MLTPCPRRLVSFFVLGVMTTAASTAVARASELPKEFEALLVYPEEHHARDLVLAGLPFSAIDAASGLPQLLWPAADGGPAAIVHERAAATLWLATQADALGATGFAPRFTDEYRWHEMSVWRFAWARDGLDVWDAETRLYWDGERLVGLENLWNARVVRIEDASSLPQDGVERCYWLKRSGVQAEAIVATVRHGVDGDWDTDEVTAPGLPGHTRFRPRNSGNHGFTFKELTEYNVPTGSFPDQIGADASRTVWFSQPNDDRITSFNPVTGKFKKHKTGAGTGPDGLFVDRKGRVWTGLYFSGEIGWWDPATQLFNKVAAPYSPANMAIPVEHTDGTIWITDHQNNRISAFSPITQQWKHTMVMPTGNCWVVQGVEDFATGDLWFTENFANQLAWKPYHQPVQDVTVPGAGPAFLGIVNGAVYYSEWSADRLGVYILATGATQEFQHPIRNELGGPLWITPVGEIVLATRGSEYVMVFNPRTRTFTSWNIPTRFAGVKDGMFCDWDGTIWFTEPSSNKIGKLVRNP